MAGSKKISQLSELSLLADEDYIEIIDSSESSQDLKNKFTTLSTLRGFLNSTTQTSDVFEDWDSGTTYDPNNGDQYVFYKGIIYFFIKGSNSTNERPDLFPLVWDAKTATDFVHVQNTDQYLDFGGANQVAVADVFLKTGARAMTGDLNMGTNDITDVGSIEIENGGAIANEAGTVIFTPNADGSFSLTGESDGFIASTTRVDISAPAFQFDTDLGVLDESWITGDSTSLELGFGTSGKATFDSTGFSLLQGTDNEFSITSAGANVIHDTFIGLQIGSDYVFSSDGTDSFIASTGEIGVTGDEINLTADASASISAPSIDLTGDVEIASGNTLTVASDTDATTILGRTKIGSPTTDRAYFAHFDKMSNTEFALMQQSSGATWVNSDTQINLAFQGGTIVNIANPGLTIGANKSFINPGSTNLVPTTPSQITSDQNDYNPGIASIFRISSDAARNITGIASSAGRQGQLVIFTNIGSFDITFVNESASSTASNRITSSTGADIVVAPNGSLTIYWDNVSMRWRDVSLR